MPRTKGEWVVEPTINAPTEPTANAAVAAPSPSVQNTEIVSAMVEALLRQSKALETQVERTAPKENPNYQVNSFFLKPSGEPFAADLQCDVYVGPSLLNRTPLTAEEVRQANRLKPMAKCRVTKMDRSVVMGSVTAQFNASDQLERLTINLPMAKDDNPQMYPPLDELLRQIADQAEQEAAR